MQPNKPFVAGVRIRRWCSLTTVIPGTGRHPSSPDESCLKNGVRTRRGGIRSSSISFPERRKATGERCQRETHHRCRYKYNRRRARAHTANGKHTWHVPIAAGVAAATNTHARTLRRKVERIYLMDVPPSRAPPPSRPRRGQPTRITWMGAAFSTPANAWVCRARNTALSNCLLPAGRPGPALRSRPFSFVEKSESPGERSLSTLSRNDPLSRSLSLFLSLIVGRKRQKRLMRYFRACRGRTMRF